MSGGSDKGAKAATQAAEVQARAQREALNYLKENEAIPQALREGALTGLGSEYGLTLGADGNVISDGQSLIQRAESSPFYQTAIQRGEEGVLRNASATGGLRSGSTNENLASVNQNALMAAYGNQLSGLQGLSQLPSNANNIASMMAGIGQTNAQGIIGSAQSSAASSQNSMNNALGMGQLALTGLSLFSDRRLKDNLQLIGRQGVHYIYTWTWNKEAEKLGLTGDSSGVIAQQVEETHPEAVTEVNGYKRVDYGMLGLSPAPSEGNTDWWV
ncbi:intamolecular chaperon [Pseudomonas phage AH02]|nr:intamolecular chaperon [Pseudomonas phage AH02]